MPESFILIFSCNDKAGIQSKVSTFLFERSAFLTDVKSFSDSETHTFFSRVVFNLSEDEFSINQIKEDFNSLAAEFDMDWEMDSADKKTTTYCSTKVAPRRSRGANLVGSQLSGGNCSKNEKKRGPY